MLTMRLSAHRIVFIFDPVNQSVTALTCSREFVFFFVQWSEIQGVAVENQKTRS
jgi:hypothetical protein